MSRVSKQFSNNCVHFTIDLQVKQEVSSILEMMTEYLKRVTDDTCGFENLIQSFSQVSALFTFKVFGWKCAELNKYE